jgi:hypothetical protein
MHASDARHLLQVPFLYRVGFQRPVSSGLLVAHWTAEHDVCGAYTEFVAHVGHVQVLCSTLT